MDKDKKLALRNELYAQKEIVTERLLKNPDLTERQLLNERLIGLNKLIDICINRNRF